MKQNIIEGSTKLRLLTTRGEIKNVAARWKEQYPDTSQKLIGGILADTVYERLCALDTEKATADEVGAIIGNNSWTDIHCDNCDSNVNVAVIVGEDLDYDTSTATVCLPCLLAATQLALTAEIDSRVTPS